MRIAALYDIHGNLPALDAVLADVRKSDVDEIIVGGDVLPGPMPREALDRLMQLKLPIRFLRGNGDRVVHAQMTGIEPTEVPQAFRVDISWTAQQLRPEHQKFIADWPLTLTADGGALGKVLFCHATPRNDRDIFTRLTPEALLTSIFQEPNVPLVVCGHSHMQFDRTIGGVRVVNAGSVGMPFGATGAFWLLLADEVQLRRTEYDLPSAADIIRKTEYPHATDFAERNLLNPPTEAAMLEAFKFATFKECA
jgi:putative phosphoesterase